jgi:uncharacterized membrane protein
MNAVKKMMRDVNVGPFERAVSGAAGLALGLCALKNRRGRWASLLAGGGLLFRGITGRSLFYRLTGFRTGGQARDYKRGIKLSELATINEEPEALYALWRDFANLPLIMRHLESVGVLDDGRSRWKTRGPAGISIEWDAEIVRDIPGRLITWQSLPGSSVIHAGSVSFDRVPGGAGTEVRVILRYQPMGGTLGAALAKILGEEPAHQVREDLRNFKRLVESGELSARKEARPV